VSARRDQFDRLDRRHSTGPLTDHVDHLLAIAADPLRLDALVDNVWRKPTGHRLEIAPPHRVKPVREDDLEVAGGCARRRHAPSLPNHYLNGLSEQHSGDAVADGTERDARSSATIATIWPRPAEPRLGSERPQ
jgi:hypothetical protein